MERITQGVLLMRIAVLKIRLKLLQRRYENSFEWYKELRRQQELPRDVAMPTASQSHAESQAAAEARGFQEIRPEPPKDQ
jgi:hypothetical protein